MILIACSEARRESLRLTWHRAQSNGITNIPRRHESFRDGYIGAVRKGFLTTHKKRRPVAGPPFLRGIERSQEKLIYYCFTWSTSHVVLTDLGRVMAVPKARFKTNCESIPIERETENRIV